MQPKPSADTSNPEFPSLRFCIISSLLEVYGEASTDRYPDSADLLPISLDRQFWSGVVRGATDILITEEANGMNRNDWPSIAPPTNQSIQDLRAELAKKIAWFIGPSERRFTEVPGLMLVRR